MRVINDWLVGGKVSEKRKDHLESWILDSKSLARPMAWVMEVGCKTAISLRIFGIRPDKKQ